MIQQTYLINLATVQLYEDISPNVKPDRFLKWVKKAQDLDLREFLKRPLWNDFIQYILPDGTIDPTAPQQYQNLLNGCEYVDLSGYAVNYEGMIPALVYWTMARFTEADTVRYTATGAAYKDNDNSKGLTITETVKLVQQHRSVANAHANEITKYLYDNISLFPLYFYDTRANGRQPGPRISEVDRTKYNGNGYGTYGYGFGIGDFIVR